MLARGFQDHIFINCPLDEAYKPLFNAIVFAVYRCGFYPVCALQESNGADARIYKIIRQIRDCKYGIHDISRTQLNCNGLPRFNMPFELGLFFGAKYFGNDFQKEKNALILEAQKYLSNEYLSDISGMDAKAHDNSPDNVIKIIWNWLSTASGRKDIPSYPMIIHDYKEFLQDGLFLRNNGLSINDLTFNDYCALLEEGLN